MIPPVDERAVRPCYESDALACVFYACDDCYAYCNMNVAKHTETDYYELERPLNCKYHFTKDEMKELIDSGAV